MSRQTYTEPPIVFKGIFPGLATLADRAALLAAHGWPVFPCRGDKAPAIRHGFKSATTDPDAVRCLFDRRTAELIGVPTGGMSGFVALDIDAKSRTAHDWWNGLSEASEHAVLVAAATSAGVPQAEAEAVVTWGLADGRSLPLSVGEGRSHD